MAPSIVDAVEATILELGDSLRGVDTAAVELARVYARAIATGDEVDKIGPKLLDVLNALLATPRARAMVLKGTGPNDATKRNPLDELRERRAAREN